MPGALTRLAPLPWLIPAFFCLPLLGCQRSQPRPAYYPTPAPTAAPYGQAPAPGTAPAAPPTSTSPSAPGWTPAQPVSSATVPFDPINTVDVNFLRGRALAVLGELVASLPQPQQGKVQGIPLITDSTVGEVNAFAACTRDGKTAMAITDGLLDIQAHLAQARAIDELFGSRKVDEYIRFIAQNQRPKTPIAQPPAGMFDAAQMADGRKVTRQHEVLDEQLAFVLGHELAHHYLGHLPCTASAGLSAAEVARVLSEAVPLFNQPNEVAADMAGLNNALTAGARRQGYHYTEGGALLTMQFFSGIDQLSPIDIVFAFERSHPAPAIRSPIIQQTAAAWRTTGGRGLPILGF